MMWCTLKTACVSWCAEGSGSECVVLFAEASGHEIEAWLEACGSYVGFRGLHSVGCCFAWLAAQIASSPSEAPCRSRNWATRR